ncbi:GTPase HflX [bacterium]|nr:GTPase HflX [bacterium]
MSKKLYGNIGGLKASHIKQLEDLYLKTVKPFELISTHLCKLTIQISKEINRMVGLLINRQGKIEYVIIGESHKIFIPDLGRMRGSGKRLRGLRLFHTKLNFEQLTIDDLNDLYKLRLDMITILTMTPNGEPDLLYSATINPIGDDNYNYLEPISIHNTDIGVYEIIQEIENSFEKTIDKTKEVQNRENAILIYVTDSNSEEIDSSMEELKALCDTAGINILESVIQKKKPNPQTVIGLGKLDEILLLSNRLNCNLLVFNHSLSPSQMKILSYYLEEKIVDRNMLILDIFAQRATSNDGKIQVELAQLKYLYPRLFEKSQSLSRLTGGIGGRGPGETKLEVDKRRIQDRLRFLEGKLDAISKKREIQRRKRVESNAIRVSLVGYTNVGKSTILNRLTKSSTFVENKLFATLETTSRSLFYNEKTFVFNDTVGFIRELPQELVPAFTATLEEIQFSDLILHVVDLSDPSHFEKMEAVDSILDSFEVGEKKVIYVFNKIDSVERDELLYKKRFYPKALFVSATEDFKTDLFLNHIIDTITVEEQINLDKI